MELARQSTKLMLNASKEFGIVQESDHCMSPRHKQRLIPLTRGIIQDMEELYEADNFIEINEEIEVDNSEDITVPIETSFIDMVLSDSFDLTSLISDRVHQRLKKLSKPHEKVARIKIQNIILEFLYKKLDSFFDSNKCNYSTSIETVTEYSSTGTIKCSELSLNSQSSELSVKSSVMKEGELFVEHMEALGRRFDNLERDLEELKVILQMKSKESTPLTSALQDQIKIAVDQTEMDFETGEPIEEKFASVFFE